MLVLPSDNQRDIALLTNDVDPRCLTHEQIIRTLKVGEGSDRRPCETDLDDQDGLEKLGNEVSRKLIAKYFCKHGFDLMMLSNLTEGTLHELKLESAREGFIAEEKESIRLQIKSDSIMVNKRAYSLLEACEDESILYGMTKETQTHEIKNLLVDVNGSLNDK